MASRYAGTPLESEYEKLQRRRALNKALMAQSIEPYGGTQTIRSGPWNFAVDDRLGTGISKIGSALISKYGEHEADNQSDMLSRNYDWERKASTQKVLDALKKNPT